MAAKHDIMKHTSKGVPKHSSQVQEIPPYSLPNWRAMLRETWIRSSDVLTIVTPLLVGGSVVLALLSHFGAEGAINSLQTPLTSWWLGLPLMLGVLRKDIFLLMIFQALGVALRWCGW